MVEYRVIRYNEAENKFERATKLTSVESEVRISVDGKYFTTSFCSPIDLEDLAVGMLAQKIIDPTRPTEGSARSEQSAPRFIAKDILECMDALLGDPESEHTLTNGVHSGVLFDPIKRAPIVKRVDVGRHNVFDKLFGWAIRNSVALHDKIIIFSGRCSTEMINKLERMGMKAVAAKSVPTTLSLARAEQMGITLAARFRSGSFCIYTHPERIIC